ncbi:MAG: hypothetical protein ABIM88_06765 [candidate division WOR-3 bacterium]
MKKLAFIVGLVLFGCEGWNMGGPDNPPDPYPLVVGNSWHYIAISGDTTDWFIDSVAAKEPFGSHQNAYRMVEMTSGKGAAFWLPERMRTRDIFEWHAFYDDDYLVFALADPYDTMEIRLFKRDPDIGDRWASYREITVYDEDGDMIEDTLIFSLMMEIVSYEDVMTPAGEFASFRSLRSEWDSLWLSGTGEWEVNTYYWDYFFWAPGVGMIKYCDYWDENQGYHLESYNLR